MSTGQVPMGDRPSQGDGIVSSVGTLVVSNVCVILGSGRKYEQGQAVAVGHPDAAELRQLGVVRPA